MTLIVLYTNFLSRFEIAFTA